MFSTEFACLQELEISFLTGNLMAQSVKRLVDKGRSSRFISRALQLGFSGKKNLLRLFPIREFGRAVFLSLVKGEGPLNGSTRLITGSTHTTTLGKDYGSFIMNVKLFIQYSFQPILQTQNARKIKQIRVSPIV